MTQRPQTIPLRGGLDLVSPAEAVRPGYLIAGENYESNIQGYGRVDGYERFDGRLKPSEATYSVLPLATLTANLTAGDTVTGGTSGATGIVLQTATVGSADHVALAEVSGTFVNTEALEVSAVQRGTAGGPAVEGGASTDALDLTYTALAVARRRALIQAVPGSGPIRGIALYGGDVYAWRDNAGGTECIMHKATTSGWAAQTLGITLPPGGTYRWIEHNFGGLAGTKTLYVVNGEGRAYSWDGSSATTIIVNASASLDKPQFIGEIANHLVLGFAGGSVQYSGTGMPASYNPADGAGEFGIGRDLTGISEGVSDSLIITARDRVTYLTGTDSTNFELKPINDESGAVADTLRVVNQPYFLDDIGVRSLRAAETFGNWSMGTETDMIEPLIRGNREGGITPIGALRVKGKNQYRLFYSNGTGISIYFRRRERECTSFRLGFEPVVVAQGTGADGAEALFAGDADGMVYQLDAGTSADGAEISAFARLGFLDQGMRLREKRYHRALLEVTAARPGAEIFFSCDFAFGNDDRPPGVEQSYAAGGGGGFWDTAIWDKFYWSASPYAPAYVDLDGIGENVSPVIMTDHDAELPHTLSTLSIFYSPRRKLR